MEGWRQWLTRPEKNLVQPKNKKTHLTPTGLLMEGVLIDPSALNEYYGDLPNIGDRRVDIQAAQRHFHLGFRIFKAARQSRPQVKPSSRKK
jgi:hypothetical protein